MPSDNRQVNVRLDPASAARFNRLLDLLPARLGMPVSQSNLIGMALKALEDQYPITDGLHGRVADGPLTLPKHHDPNAPLTIPEHRRATGPLQVPARKQGKK